MAEKSNIIEVTDRYTVGNYARMPVAFVRGEGRRLHDDGGKIYLDMFSGLGVSCLGHGHAGLARAIAEQAATLLHTSNIFYNEPSARLAEELATRTFADRVFFCNSGTEANEAAIKMARRHHPDRYEIVTVDGSFHGRTLGALAATGQPNLQEGFGPMPEGFIHVERCSAEAIGEVVGPKTAAVLIEPIIGEGGVIVPPAGYLEAVRAICDGSGALLVFDEVQCGCGRTGDLFAYQTYAVTPDLLCSAKGLAGGLPIGAVLATEAASKGLVPGTHGTTFGANPVACSAALAVLDAFDAEGVLENCRRSGDHLGARLAELASRRDDIAEARGVGLMRALELDRPGRPVVAAALSMGLVMNATAGNVLRFLPPLTITIEEIDEGVEILSNALDASAGKDGN
jgi:acetylornithine/N-succinyldiaminopimelate aminotransferase